MIKFLKGISSWLDGIESQEVEEATFTLKLDGFVVGYLRREGDAWQFEYAPEFQAQHEVKPIVDFPDLSRCYDSEDLWPFFALRIPARHQPGVKRRFAENPDLSPDTVTMLKQFGRRSIANPFELEPA